MRGVRAGIYKSPIRDEKSLAKLKAEMTRDFRLSDETRELRRKLQEEKR